MGNENVGVFWSYAHEDDRIDSGNIVALANNLSNEFSLNTGRELELFLDCDSLDWGHEWRKRINGALVDANFFIPIITPRYFQRTECRNEALSFHGKAKSLGVEDLLLPILYAPVPEFDESNSDELKSLLSKYQYVDWRGLRLEDPRSVDYRKAVHRLALRLIELEADINQKRLTQELAEVQEDSSSASDAGYLDVIEEIKVLLPDWIESLESRDVSLAQSIAVSQIYEPRLTKLEASPGNAGAKFALTQRFVKEKLPLADRWLGEAEIYSKKSVQLDPLMLRLLRFIEQEPEVSESMGALKDSLVKAKHTIVSQRARRARGIIPGSEWARARAHMSRLVKQLADVYDRAEEFTNEGNRIVENWIGEWERATGSSLSEDTGDSAAARSGALDLK